MKLWPMKLITNNGKNDHLSMVLPLLKQADEVFIAVAFLKESGLKPLLPAIKQCVKDGRQICVVAGQNFGLTEPDALHTLRLLFDKRANAKVYIAHATNAGQVFHPKMYLFRTGETVTLISGSANITSGGLVSNVECSLLAETDVNSQLWKDSVAFYTSLRLPTASEEATLVAIKKYESYYLKQKAAMKKSRAVPDRTKVQRDFNYGNLLQRFKSFNNKNRDEEFKRRTEEYAEAKKVLDKIADTPRLTEAGFLSLLEDLVGRRGEYGWWHSGSMGRLKNDLAPYFKEFAELVRFIRDNQNGKPAQVFDGAVRIVKEIYGADVNYVTEIMMTYNPVAFANINRNPIKVLTDVACLNIKKTYRIYSGADYELYCDIIKEITEKLGIYNMLEVDSYFNAVYQTITKHKL